ncbi:MAG: phenylacetate--CoA ligase family protein [Deltaproteobacteria bacterium]|nr:phenylacetate--CoA ligase family protein [Deltaproteobacteria bacterium]
MSLKEKERLEKAFQVFKEALESVPAYRDFLKRSGFDPNFVKGPQDFEKIPITDKEQYLRKYKLPELCLNGTLKGMHTVYRSAGTTGEPLFWPRLPEEEAGLPAMLSRELNATYNTEGIHTLIVAALPLGSWLRGGEVTWAAHAAALSTNGAFTCVTPGDDVEETVRVIKMLGEYYQQIVLVCYPPRLLPIIDMGEKSGLDWPGMKIRFAFVGESVSEEWRSKIGSRIGLSETELLATWGNYGGTETGRVGRETPFTVLLRRKASEDEALCKELFGKSRPPFLCERDPAAAQVEVIDGEMVFTKHQAVPLVRYNIHDRGAIISRHRINEIFAARNIDLGHLLQNLGFSKRDSDSDAPILAIYGRSEGAVRFMGVEIHPSQVIEALVDSPLKGSCTRNVKLVLETGYRGEQQLRLIIELADGLVPEAGLKRRFAKIISENLRKVNPAFNTLCNTMGKDAEQCFPNVELLFFGSWEDDPTND